MAQYKVVENQLYPAKSWNGITTKEHFYNVFKKDP